MRRIKRLLCLWIVLTMLSVVVDIIQPIPSIYDPFCEDSCLSCVERQDTLIDRYFWCCISDWTCWFYFDLYREWYCPRRKYLCLQDKDPTIEPYTCYGSAKTDECTEKRNCCDFGL